jgi:DNA-binding CsgD family transcriptional regulator
VAPLLGRDRELARIDAALSAAADASAVLTIDGPAGMGKSALLGAALDAAASSGALVLRCAPTVAEADLAFAALGDLLEPVADLSMLDDVPRSALERALLRSPFAPGVELDARVVGTACVALLRAVSADRPVVVAIDDVQWLDAASAAALVFAARRLPPTGVLVLGTRRTGEPGPELPGAVERLGRLDDQVVRRIVGRRSDDGRPASAKQTAAVVAAAAGNPLLAIELARASTIDDVLTVPRALPELVGVRLEQLEPDVVEALTFAALAARPDLALFRRLELVDAIERAERAGVVATGTGRVVFAHPLYAAAVTSRAAASTLRRLHLRLADVVDDSVEAVLHAARAADEPDAALAARLSGIADELLGRAAAQHAAEYAVLAAQRSPADDPMRAERHIVAARASFRAGDTETANRMLSDLGDAELSPAVRVRELVTRAYIAYSDGGEREALQHATAALDHCSDDAERIEVHALLARVNWEDFTAAAAHAARALELLERTEVGLELTVAAMLSSAEAAFMIGQGLDHELFRRTIELERDLAPAVADSALAAYAALLKYAGELDPARELLVTLLDSTEDEGSMPFALSHLPQLEVSAGNWDAAEDYAQRHLEAAERTGQDDQASQARFNLGLVSLSRGDVAAARPLAEEVHAAGVASESRWIERTGIGLLAQCALAEGDATTAADLLDRWHALSMAMGIGDPGYLRLQPDHVEALVACGRLDEADGLATSMRDRAQRLRRPTAIAAAARVTALVAAARGDHDAAVRAAQEAETLYAASPMVFDHARALLTLGQIHRRFREKAAARDALQRALEVFERLGAEQFAARARQDLARIGLRPAAGLALTETERRVAELAATGRTVRQVGDELFISPKTVEANLTRVYRKLGLSGRAELATWLADRR